jgi:hypothetical protein
MIKLEVGKYYKSRDGRKWKCVHQFEKNNNLLFANENGAMTLLSSGLRTIVSESDVDIISEWVEPVKYEVDVCFYNDYAGGLYCNIINFCEESEGAIAKIKVKFTEGEGL